MVFVTAHLDTVFPENTDVSVKEKEGRICAPGINDHRRSDGAGLGGILTPTGLGTMVAEGKTVMNIDGKDFY